MKFRTDLAFDEIQILNQDNNFKNQRKYYRNIVMNHVQIFKENNVIDKNPNDYITIEFESLNDHHDRDDVGKVIQEVLEQLMDKNVKKILFVGLGNQNVTADMLGPLVAEKIVVTSHLFRLEKKKLHKDVLMLRY